MKIHLIAAWLLGISTTGLSQTIPEKEASYIREMQLLAEELKTSYWPAWKNTPFTLLLISGETEFLVNHPNAPSFSGESYHDTILDTEVFVRKRVFQQGLSATFPLLDPTPVIVIGAIKHSNFDEVRWRWTLLHEHFHQFQMSSSGYFQAANNLELASGPNDGMWQLNYPFPYMDKTVSRQIEKMCALLKQLKNANPKRIAKQYLKSKERLKKTISEKDYRYLNFQIWQEGLPRFLELTLLDFLDEKQEVEFGELRDQYMNEILTALANPSIEKRERTLFYSLGAAEWMLIDQVNESWKDTYLKQFFETDYLMK